MPAPPAVTIAMCMVMYQAEGECERISVCTERESITFDKNTVPGERAFSTFNVLVLPRPSQFGPPVRNTSRFPGTIATIECECKTLCAARPDRSTFPKEAGMLIKNAHIWIARFDSEAAFAEYLDERLIEEEDEEEEGETPPISQFAEDQGETFYDHDLVSGAFLGEPGTASLIECWNLPENIVKRVTKAIDKLGVTTANASIVADGKEFADPNSATGDGYELWYVGQFNGCSM